MDTAVAKDIIRVIRAEKDGRSARLRDEDPDVAYDRWLSTEAPFVNELCLMLLVAIRHQLERELLRMAACATDDGKDIDGVQFQQRLGNERKEVHEKGWKKIIAKLKLKSFPAWDSSMETLRLLANSYKHNPSQQPDDELLKHLKLDPTRKYMPLPESTGVQEGLAADIHLRQKADYCDITEELLKQAACFLADVQKQTVLSKVRWGRPVSLSPDDFAY